MNARELILWRALVILEIVVWTTAAAMRYTLELGPMLLGIIVVLIGAWDEETSARRKAERSRGA